MIISILLIGDSTVGKTSVIRRFMEPKSNKISTYATVGLDYYTKNRKIKNKVVKLSLIDTSGQERYQSIGRNYYKGADGILLVFDVTNIDTFNHCEFWLKEIAENSIEGVKVILFGNKTDIEDREKISKEVIDDFIKKNKLEVFEGSAKTGEKVQECINKLVTSIFDSKHQDVESNDDVTIKLGDTTFYSKKSSPSASKIKERKRSLKNTENFEKGVPCC